MRRALDVTLWSIGRIKDKIHTHIHRNHTITQFWLALIHVFHFVIYFESVNHSLPRQRESQQTFNRENHWPLLSWKHRSNLSQFLNMKMNVVL